jgi:ABC-type oligopeptide transport system substrate-binding subunit
LALAEVFDRTREPFSDSRVWEALYLSFDDERKAKKMLTEAGYPNGFKITLNCDAIDAESLKILLPHWVNIGVEAQLEVKE